jgi:hypothetical protein
MSVLQAICLFIVGVVEIVFGSLILLVLFTRPAALILLINITVALISTKLPILRVGNPVWKRPVRCPDSLSFELDVAGSWGSIGWADCACDAVSIARAQGHGKGKASRWRCSRM